MRCGVVLTLGYRVTCVEPDRDLWPDGADWLVDGLPAVKGMRGTSDLITIGAVWPLLPEHDRGAAFARISALPCPVHPAAEDPAAERCFGSCGHRITCRMANA